MTMKPMMFNTEMVRAIREGRKTVTRRPVKGYALEHLQVDVDGSVIGVYEQDEGSVFPAVSFAQYRPGDVVYAPEAWRLLEMRPYLWNSTYVKVEFKNGDVVLFQLHSRERAQKWRKYLEKPKDKWQSPYHMPREAARIFLRVTDVRVERVQEIDEAQARAEGARPTIGIVKFPENKAVVPRRTAVEDFSRIWDSTIKRSERALYGWDANPWAWVIGFERISKEEAKCRL